MRVSRAAEVLVRVEVPAAMKPQKHKKISSTPWLPKDRSEVGGVSRGAARADGSRMHAAGRRAGAGAYSLYREWTRSDA